MTSEEKSCRGACSDDVETVPLGSRPFVTAGPSTLRAVACRGFAGSSTFHHRGLASISHLSHFRSGFGTDASAGSSSLIGSPAFDCRPRADVGVWFAIVDVRRLFCTGADTCGTIRVD